MPRLILGGNIMYQIDNQKFGEFVAQLRREKHLTQKEFAVRLFVSDKAVSKWERGLSIPNVSLLVPMADILGVTVTELLEGQRMEEEQKLNVTEVEKLVTCSIGLTAAQQADSQHRKRKWLLLYLFCITAAAIELAGLCFFDLLPSESLTNTLLIEGLFCLFGCWVCLFAKETLPSYYDENDISFVTDGVFRINMVGLRFHNSNWPHILNTLRIWLLATVVIYPALFAAVQTLLKTGSWFLTELIIPLAAALSIFIPVYYFGKKYE